MPFILDPASQVAGDCQFEAFADANVWRKSMPTLFNPKIHLSYVKPTAIHTMKSLGLPDIGVASIAASEPFQLFSPEAIDIMRNEALSDVVQDRHFFGCDLAPFQLRGYASE
jgi:hypothetical protein